MNEEQEIEALKKENAELKEKIECLNIIVETLREVNAKVTGHNEDFKQIREHLEQKEKEANKADWWKKEA
jgi:FtsZ-binding cell division protein ZapB